MTSRGGGTYFCRLLPVEVLEVLALRLDPSSLKAFTATSKAIRSRLKSDAFWLRYAKAWAVPVPPKRLLDKDKSVWERMVALAEIRRNVRGNKCRAWMWDCQSGPFQVEEEGLVIDEREGDTVAWNDRYAIHINMEPNASLQAWDTSDPSSRPAKLEFLEADEKPGAIMIWRNYILFTPSVEEKVLQLTLLKVFDVLDCSVPVAVTVLPMEDVEIVETIMGPRNVVDVLETRDGSAKAVVFQELQPGTAFIVGLPDGVLERKICLPIGARCTFIWGTVEHSPHFHPSVGVRLMLEQWDTAYLTITSTSRTETKAKIVMGTKMKYETFDVTEEGACLIVEKREEEEVDGFREVEYSLVMVAPSADVPRAGDLNLKFSSRSSPAAKIPLTENAVHVSRLTVNNDFRTAMMLCEYQGYKEVVAVRYRVDPSPELCLLYRLNPTSHVTDLSTCFDRFITLSYDNTYDPFNDDDNDDEEDAAAPYSIAFRDVRTGEMLAEKSLHVVGKTAEFVSCEMGLSDVMLEIGRHPFVFGKKLCLIKY